MNVRISAMCLAIAAGLAQSGTALAADANEGRRLADLWCASCHLVAPDQKQATTEAPPFEGIAERFEDPAEHIKVFLTRPHPPMPDIPLTRAEIDNLAAYIASLKHSE